MAVHFLEMMDSPEKFDYFKRFVDNDKYAEMTWKYLTGAVDEEKELEKLKDIQ
jgi:coenzyme F420-reducing hydrogenase gamma subunit